MTFEFKGWDWTELISVLGLDEEYTRDVDNAAPENFFEAEKAFIEKMGNIICGYPHNHTEEETEVFIGHLRAFLRKVADLSGYYKPYFEGILNLEDMHVFCQIYASNVGSMWT